MCGPNVRRGGHEGVSGAQSLGTPGGGGGGSHPRWRLHANETGLLIVCVRARVCASVCLQGKGRRVRICQAGQRALQNFWKGIEPELA